MAKLKAETVPGGKDRVRVYAIIDNSCTLAFRKGPHPLTPDCQCLACMTKRKKILYPLQSEWKYTI